MNRSSNSNGYDQNFIALLRQQDSAAFKKFFDQMAEVVFRRSFALLGDESAAEDATQEIFYKAWQYLPRIEGGNLKGWILTIARNHCFDEIRQRRRRPAVTKGSSDLVEKIVSDKTAVESDPNELLASVPEEIRVPLLLKVVEGLSYKEISEMVEKSEGTLRNLVCRGMKILRKELDENEM
ncbi:MAG: RNA polymerase sigma factor [Candidatus Rifleibacteriota bacterium]